MTGFYADTTAMTGLHDQVFRVHEDAEAAKTYLETYADISLFGEVGEEGLIFDLLNVHDTAYSLVHGAFDKLSQIGSASATVVSDCKTTYEETDQAGAEELDATMPGASNPTDLHSILRPPTYESSAPPGPPFTDSADPAAQFTCAPSLPPEVGGFQIDLLTDALSPSSWVRAFAKWAISWDPYEKVFIWLTGDWDAYSKCAEVWTRLSTACTQLGDNMFSAARDTTAVWRGNAAEACQETLVKTGATVYELSTVCTTLSEQYTQAATLAKNVHEALVSLLGMITDYCIAGAIAAGVGTGTAETGVGAVGGFSAAAFFAAEAIKIAGHVTSVYGWAKAAFFAISSVVGAIELASMDALSIPEPLAPATN